MSADHEVADTAPDPHTTPDGDEAPDDAADRGDGSGGAGPAGAGGRRRLLTAAAWLVAFGLWAVVCFVWLFPLLTELGLDPTLGS